MEEDVVRTHLVELDRYKILGPLKGAPDLNHFLHKKRFLVTAATWKRISKITKLTKIFWDKGQLDPQDNVTLIHPMSYKSQSFTDEILQCLVKKYKITYQIIWGEGLVRPHLVESSREGGGRGGGRRYCKIMGSQFYTI